MNPIELVDSLVMERLAPFYEELDQRLRKIEGDSDTQSHEQPQGKVIPLGRGSNGSTATPEPSNDLQAKIDAVIKLHRLDATPVLHVTDNQGRMVPAGEDMWEVGCVICKTTVIITQGEQPRPCKTVELLTNVLQNSKTGV